MFLLGVELVLGSYAGLRLYENVNTKLSLSLKNKPLGVDAPKIVPASKPTLIHKLNTAQVLAGEKTPEAVDKVVENGQREKNLHYIKVSGLSVSLAALSTWNPIFLPVMLATFTYAAIPYLRVIENSLLKKKKIDGYVLYGIADFMTLGLGKTIIASCAVCLVHTAHFVVSNAEKDSKQSLVNIFSEQPNQVWLLKDGVEIETALANIQIGDTIVINSGDVIPVDGTIVAGIASIDQQALTGESQPAEKIVGDEVFAATQVMSGRIQVKVSTSGNNTTVAKITRLLNHSVDFKTSTQLKGEQWADNWNLPVLSLAFAAMPILGPIGTIVILNGHIAQNIRVVAPLSTLNYLSLASHQGILIKDGRVLEDLPNVDTFLFDKTGTLTAEEPEVAKIWCYLTDYDEHDVLMYAAAAERQLKHPIARAILNRAAAEGIDLPLVDDSEYSIGYGVSVRINQHFIQVGSRRFMEREGVHLPIDFDTTMQSAYAMGHSLIMVAIDGELAGVLEMQAAIRPEVIGLLAALRQHGVKHLAIVSGDHRQPTQKLAETLGMDDYFHDVMPQDKASIVETLQAQGRTVCFIGDGVNDTLAMKKANISISLSGASSVATDTAQIILMDGSLSRLNTLWNLATKLNQNLDRGWLFNIVPGTLTIIAAFALHINIATALLLSQGGLALGVINAMSPLRKAKKLEQNTQAD